MTPPTTPGRGVRVLVCPPLVAVGPADRCHVDGLVLTATRRILMPRLSLTQDEKTLAERRFGVRVAPGRTIRVPKSFFDAVVSGGGDVFVGIADDAYIPCGFAEGGPYLGITGP
jgi:hypothetical protein